MAIIRLDKYISSSLVISRKDATSVIKSGRVAIDGVVTKKADTKINTDNSSCTLDGNVIGYQENIYIMLNKPQGLICALEDARDKTVMSLFPQSYLDKGLFCCGRLDKDTVGILILTTDGVLSHKLLSPKHHAEKLYYVECDKPFTDSDITLMQEGITMDGKKTKPARLVIDGENPHNAKITLTEGKFHEIKRLCYACSQKEVLYLKRLQFGGLELDETLSEGEWRELTQEEIEILKSNS